MIFHHLEPIISASCGKQVWILTKRLTPKVPRHWALGLPPKKYLRYFGYIMPLAWGWSLQRPNPMWPRPWGGGGVLLCPTKALSTSSYLWIQIRYCTMRYLSMVRIEMLLFNFQSQLLNKIKNKKNKKTRKF